MLFSLSAMKRIGSMSPQKLHWLLGGLTVLHSAVILGCLILREPAPGPWFDRLWFALTTLWFFWPIVLVFHRGRSLVRIAVPLVLAGCFITAWFRWYSMIGAPAFGLPMGCDLNPVTMTRFFAAYLRGRADAYRGIRDGHLTVEVSGLGAGIIAQPLKERFNVETRVVAGCIVDDIILGHERGYNIVSAAEIKRRSGIDLLRSDSGGLNFDLLLDERGQPR